MAINKVGSKGIVDCAVATADFAPGTVSSGKFVNSTIANAKLSNSSITVAGQSIALGASGTVGNQFVEWQSKITSDGSTVTTMVAGRGYFVDNSSAAGFVKLPASASIGDTIILKDYAASFGTNKLTIQRNSHKVQGATENSEITTARASVVLVYVDATQGWLYSEESNVGDLEAPSFVTATGGTVTTSGNFKIHTFTGDGNFVVSAAGNPKGSNTVSYIVVAGGGAGAWDGGAGGGGAGGFREGLGLNDSYTGSPLRSPTGVPVSVTTFPVTVGGGAAAGQCAVGKGSNSVFSTITSTGGGGAGTRGPLDRGGQSGGSGGGGGGSPGSANNDPGSGNTPPVSPPQGSNGGEGDSGPPFHTGAGGGGATAVGQNSQPNGTGGRGGAGATTSITGSPLSYSGGGGAGGGSAGGPGAGGTGGAASPCGTGGRGQSGAGAPSVAADTGTTNRGGGGGGGLYASGTGKAGGKGIVIIRYKFQ
jgi:hypothetical protein